MKTSATHRPAFTPFSELIPLRSHLPGHIIETHLLILLFLGLEAFKGKWLDPRGGIRAQLMNKGMLLSPP